MTVNDHRSISNRVLNLYLYPVAGWGLALAACYASQQVPFALFLCYPLAIWYIGLTIFWFSTTSRRVQNQEITGPELTAGVVSVVRILAGAAMSPAIVFMANDPFSTAAWSTSVGVTILFAIAWFGGIILASRETKTTYIAALVLALLALPLSATGAVTVATFMGMYELVVDKTPLPDVLRQLD